GLVGWWSGNGNANDVINNQDGTLQGSTTYAPGLGGQVFSFDGLPGGVYVSNPPDLNLTAVTVSAWIELSALPSPIADYSVLSMGLGNGYENYGLYIDTSPGHPRLLLEWSNNGFQEVISDALDSTAPGALDFVPGAFDNVAVTADGTTVCFYLDGSPVG